jgi:intracellular septation protein
MTSETKATEPSWDELKPQIIKMALELGPLLVFYVCTIFGESWLAKSELLRALFASPLVFATAPFMVAMVISLVISWLLFKRIAVMPLITLAMVLIFGTLTLVLQNSIFIKIKPTVVNSLFAAALLGGLLFRQSLLKYVFGEVYQLQPKGWQILTLRWGLFFAFLAVLNEVAWRGASFLFADSNAADQFYAGFKLWATMPITILFSALQLPLLRKYSPEPIKPVEAITPIDPLP